MAEWVPCGDGGTACVPVHSSLCMGVMHRSMHAPRCMRPPRPAQKLPKLDPRWGACSHDTWDAVVNRQRSSVSPLSGTAGKAAPPAPLPV